MKNAFLATKRLDESYKLTTASHVMTGLKGAGTAPNAGRAAPLRAQRFIVDTAQARHIGQFLGCVGTVLF